ncbi:helix-turn-helix domain-containing protein [Francisella philomiragia]|uniref:Winged helix-turn-helix domain-containing protein n=1 Tax=Francisella philomiragia TaxID=28110 RepID=A0ABS1GD68_9GAMM|nr:helix-turn-helix domain-containing protein [Francisella philomiragia]MBK2259182.1 hypothetical protein [Francisella philomiragia]MBK2302781.1 hypothetical protein [Francisella philomiragia]
MKVSKECKNQKVFEHLNSGMTLTPAEAYKQYGTMRLGAIVYDLKQKGYHIENINPRGKYAVYKMVKFTK